MLIYEWIINIIFYKYMVHSMMKLLCYSTVNKKIDTLISQLSYHVVCTKRKITMKNSRG